MRDDVTEWLRRLYVEAVPSGAAPATLSTRIDVDVAPEPFAEALRDAARSGQSLTVIGAGTGAFLTDLLTPLAPLSAGVTALEAWKDHRKAAAARLAPLGVSVAPYDPELGQAIPLATDSQDVVFVRDELIDADDIARVLRPGGRLFGQQQSADDAIELREWFGRESEAPENTPGAIAQRVTAAGLVVDECEEWIGSRRFRDVGTLVEFLALAPWEVPDFDIDEAASVLGELAAVRPLVVSQRRLFLSAHRPA